MMKFSVCLLEPEGYKYSHFLYDVCKYYCYTIEEAGYDCCIVKNKLYPDKINIILGSHNLTDPDMARHIKQSGKYIIMQSELLREGGITGWPDQPSFHSIYVPLMKQAFAVWDGIPANEEHLRKLGIQSDLIPRWGYLPALEEIRHKKNKDIDFLHYGSLTPHRLKMVEALRKRGGDVVCIFDEAAIYRNDYIARTRVNLAPIQAPGNNNLTSRILYLLNNRALVAVERCKDQDWVEHCFPSADTESWVDICLETLHRPDREQIAEEFFDRYKKLSMAHLMQPILEKLQSNMTSSKGSRAHADEKSHASVSYFNEEAIAGLTSIIIVTHHHLEQTKKCVKSIRKHTPQPHEIIFVDFGSADGTVKWLQSQTRENKNYRLIENKEDVERSKSPNQGIEASRGEFIVLLDQDALVTEGWLDSMLHCLNSGSDNGIIGPMSNHANGRQKLTDDAYPSVDFFDKYAAIFKERFHYRRFPCQKVAGFCMLFKRTLTEKIGLIDERLVADQFADEDYCVRAALEGYKNLIAGDVLIHQSIGKKINQDRKIILDKWTLSLGTAQGRKLAVLKTMEFADTLYAQGKTDQAIEALINCIKFTPDEKNIYYELARILLESKRFSEAWEVLGTTPEGARNELKGLEYSGYITEGLDQDDEAAAFADRMLSLEGRYPPALNLKGILAYKRGETDQAQDYFQKAIDADPGYGEAWTNLGVLYWKMDKPEEALAHLKSGFILSPAVPDVSSLYYSVVSSLGAYHEAEADFREALKFYPGNKKLIFLSIDILIQQGKFDEALYMIQDALSLYGPDEEMLNAALSVRDKIGPLQIEKASKKGSLSLSMIVKNEERYLIPCLKSIRDVVDEMIIVDTGSTDKTVDIARIFGAKIFDFPWTGDFAAARNYALEKASGHWILILDGDEVLSSLDFKELKEIISRKSSQPAAYSIVTRNYVTNVSIIGWTKNDGKYPEEAGTGWIDSKKVRLLTRSKDAYFSNPVHETMESSLIEANIPIYACNIVVHHYGKLDTAKDLQKGEDYYLLGKIKYENDPNNTKYVLELARQAQVLGKHEEAIELWIKLIDLVQKADPDSLAYQEVAQSSHGDPLAEIYTQLASAYLMLDRFEEALTAARKSMVGNSTKQKEYVHVYAHAEIIAGSLDNASGELAELLEKTPDYPPAVLLMAVVSCLKGKNEEAKESFKWLIRQGVYISPLLNTYGRQLRAVGKKNEALMLLNAAVEGEAGDAETIKIIMEIQQE